eukprot:COSAG02_NODE_90_length_37755_cov_29.833364_37_plen_56_part_00
MTKSCAFICVCNVWISVCVSLLSSCSQSLRIHYMQSVFLLGDWLGSYSGIPETPT